MNDWICFLPQIFPYLDESSPKYDPGVALITWQEFQTAMAKENKKIFKKRTEGYAKRAVFALNILNRYAYYTKFSPVPLSSLSDQWKVCLYEYQEGQRLSRQRV